MKINALALKNLNSLRGEFRLDFDAEPLVNAGIFAITGPTGAGKTTLLDAICVALYGQTPRLPPGSSAELLTRNTGECFAEVEFTVEQGRFRSRWSRRRARGRADGNLQPTAMELVAIAADGDERIVEDQVRQVVDRVEALTGLDFARFTRSVLLAQGSFASFLKAKDNERAELLERMTGTRLYSFISIQAFNRAREERQRLDELIAVNAHLALLPPEEMAALRTRRAGLEAESAAAVQHIATLREREAIALRYRQLIAAIAETEQAVSRVVAEQSEAAPSLARLAEAEAALPLAADLRALDSLAENLTCLHTEAHQLHSRADTVRQEDEAARRARSVLDREAEAFARTAAVREEGIRAAEVLDRQLALQRTTLAGKEEARKKCDDELAALRAETLGQGQALAEAISRREALEAVLAEHAADAGLARDIGIFAASLQELVGVRQRFAANRRERERIGAEIERLGQEAARSGELRIKAGEQGAVTRQALGDSEARLVEVLQGQTFDGVESAIGEGRKRLERIERVLALTADLRGLEADRGAKESLAADLARKMAADTTERNRIEAEKAQAEQILALQEEKQRLAFLVAKYEADRTRLTDGQPCPLCGSPSHPWQAGAPETDADAEAVERQRRTVKGLLTSLAELEGRMRERAGSAEEIVRHAAELGAAAIKLKNDLARAITEAGLAEPGDAAEIKAVVLAAVSADQDRLSVGRKLQTERETLLRALFDHDKAEAALVAALSKSEALIREQAAALQRLRDEEAELCRQGTALSGELEAKLAGYGVTVPPPGREEATAELLRQRWQRFDQARQDRAPLDSQVQEIQRTLDVLAEREAGARTRRELEATAASECIATIAALTLDRTARLGSESIETASQRLAEERAAFTARIKESDRILAECATTAATIAGALTANAEQAKRFVDESRRLGQALAGRLLAAGIADLPALRTALLPDVELQALREWRDELVVRRCRLEERLTESRTQCESLSPEAAGLDPEALCTAIAQAGEALSARQQELGALGESIRRQEELSAQHRQRAEEIESQRREQQQWQLLNDLIGSADGKKFRRFAQGLTLDHLILLANRQLVRLSDRYLLRRHQEEELGLEIIDTYQADAIRPTGTLSGGEEFLVSLALALGLANLAGQTRIDSLFLDEGFGTLDTDTLETALAALAALHETGKTIGVISHVDALKERIPVQIRLRRLAGGCSEVAVVAG